MIKETTLAKELGLTRTAVMQCRIGRKQIKKGVVYSYPAILDSNDYIQKIVDGRNTTFITESGIEKIKAKFNKKRSKRAVFED